VSEINFRPMTGESLAGIEKRKLEKIDASPTPYPSWNEVCGEEGGRIGLAKGWVVTIGGKTGTGKSYLAINLAANAVRQGKVVAIINFEMSYEAMATRYLSVLSGLEKYRMDRGEWFDPETWRRASRMADQVREETGGVLLSNESTLFSLGHIRESYERMNDAGVDMIVVDYAQLVSVEGAAGIYQRSEATANELGELAHRYGITTVPISQLNREDVKSGKPPTIHGLLGGGIWEHRSDQIWLLDHTLRYKLRDQGRFTGEYTKLICGKNRHGIEPTLSMHWSYENMRFDEINPNDLSGEHPFVEEEENTVTVGGYEEPADVPPQDQTGDLFDD